MYHYDYHNSMTGVDPRGGLNIVVDLCSRGSARVDPEMFLGTLSGA